MTDTVYAVATAQGRAAVAILRLSGPGTEAALRAICGDVPPPRRAVLRALRHDGVVIDQALVLWFPAPGSYTGEDAAELQVHGGPAVIRACSDVLSALGLRPAEPGEFTRRAFQNGRMDLAQAEGVADLVDAETEAQRRQALDQLGGALGRRYEAWRDTLLNALALLEAEIDFPDEDLPGALGARVAALLAPLREELTAALAEADRGRRIRDGWRVALIGAPNAGKSSLFNALVGRDAAIVTATPGTTRDVIEAVLVLGGYKILIADTAGVRESAEPIEAEGVRRARAWADAAALRLWVVDASAEGPEWREATELVRAGDLLVLNKDDLAPGAAGRSARDWADAHGVRSIACSARTTAAALLDVLHALAVARLQGADTPPVTRERHLRRLREAEAGVAAALQAMDQAPELAAEELRRAGAALGRVTGRIDPEDVLDLVFGQFCIGK